MRQTGSRLPKSIEEVEPEQATLPCSAGPVFVVAISCFMCIGSLQHSFLQDLLAVQPLPSTMNLVQHSERKAGKEINQRNLVVIAVGTN